jgi:hypothetical protein
MNFIKLILHKFKIYLWLFKIKTKPLDFLGASFLSMAGRWHGELNPILSYIPMFDLLRQNKVSGEFLELGGGYSTVLAANMLDPTLIKIRSVDLNPDKYNRILNSISSRQNFLKSIDNVERPTVSLEEAFTGLESVRQKLQTFGADPVHKALAKYAHIPADELQSLVSAIFSNDGGILKSFIVSHSSYADDLKFYEATNYVKGEGFCTSLKKSGYAADAIFFDCGEVSSIGEWAILEDAIKVGGYALFHDIYYPKSIKNFLIVAYVDLAPNWKVCYVDKISPQGGLVALKLS